MYPTISDATITIETNLSVDGFKESLIDFIKKENIVNDSREKILGDMNEFYIDPGSVVNTITISLCNSTDEIVFGLIVQWFVSANDMKIINYEY